MSNPEHLALIKQGVDIWNRWRDENPEIAPDLREADLQGLPLEGINFEGVILAGADLRRASLQQARFSEARGWGTQFQGANLMRAHFGPEKFDVNLILQRPLLEAAKFSHADFTFAKLDGANFDNAVLRRANFSKASLIGASLKDADLSNSSFIETNARGGVFKGANLQGAKLQHADLTKTQLDTANLGFANLSKSILKNASLTQANLLFGNLSGAVLRGANLRAATLTEADLTHADLTGCQVYGAAIWNVKLVGAIQQNLVITRANEPAFTLDSLEIASFIYMLLDNEKIRHVIDIATTKIVLILGSFKDERKAVLDTLRDELRKHDFLPILFDFDRPASRTTDETVGILARLAQFIVADLTDAKSILQELRGIVPELPLVPICPLLLSSQCEPGMFDYFHKYPWVLETHYYSDANSLVRELTGVVIDPAINKVEELQEGRN